MKYFFDTEFVDTGSELILISLGIVSEKGKTKYWESDEFDPLAPSTSDWLTKNVVPSLHRKTVSRKEIRQGILDFVGDDASPEFWAYFAAYDWVLFCQLFGRMLDLPRVWPMFCRDIQIVRMQLGGLKLPQHSGTVHNALDDALWTQQAYIFLRDYSAEFNLNKVLFR